MIRTALGRLSIALLLITGYGCASVSDLEKLQTKVNLLQQQIDIDSSVSASAKETAKFYESKATEAESTATLNATKLQDIFWKLNSPICRRYIDKKTKRRKSN
ncbi:hypothetical protein [Methylomonas sp. ZR1]|uniref:hypothetical protein n=1 Tax=Methylomonas sp. ZR1 TaxID=1797072 RepID=UPI0014924612|nr:hypothetical protein [Methylomonas sp. ZR1]NOV28488.1 hypothetical protein [Methylomonas sp. ZR1]